LTGDSSTLIKYLFNWIPMLVIAVAHGALRQFTFASLMPEIHAHQFSTLTGSVFIGLYIWFVVRRWPPSSDCQAVQIGIIWTILTVAFEFFMGLVLAQKPLADIMHDYNLFAGRVWVLFLVWLSLAPWVLLRISRKKSG
jgi:cobalamin biosynthesis protein CobD/CbiB